MRAERARDDGSEHGARAQEVVWNVKVDAREEVVRWLAEVARWLAYPYLERVWVLVAQMPPPRVQRLLVHARRLLQLTGGRGKHGHVV